MSINEPMLFYGNKVTPSLDEWTEKPHWNQVHGIHAVEITQPGQQCGDADALWTRLPNFRIGVRAADCVPILMAYQSVHGIRAVAAIHAGWRGTIERIVQHFLDSLPEDLAHPKHWKAWLGPSIRACCYEVGPDLIEKFQTEFSEIPAQTIAPKPRHLDLIAVNRAQLQDKGVQDISIHPECTFCSEKYFSYRKGDRNARQHSIISF